MAPAIARLMRDLPEDDLAAAARILTAVTDRANEILTDQMRR